MIADCQNKPKKTRKKEIPKKVNAQIEDSGELSDVSMQSEPENDENEDGDEDFSIEAEELELPSDESDAEEAEEDRRFSR